MTKKFTPETREAYIAFRQAGNSLSKCRAYLKDQFGLDISTARLCQLDDNRIGAHNATTIDTITERFNTALERLADQ